MHVYSAWFSVVSERVSVKPNLVCSVILSGC